MRVFSYFMVSSFVALVMAAMAAEALPLSNTCYADSDCTGESVIVRSSGECASVLRSSNLESGSFRRARGVCRPVSLSPERETWVHDPYLNGQPQFNPPHECTQGEIRAGTCI